jgi:hypothetical protein
MAIKRVQSVSVSIVCHNYRNLRSFQQSTHASVLSVAAIVYHRGCWYCYVSFCCCSYYFVCTVASISNMYRLDERSDVANSKCKLMTMISINTVGGDFADKFSHKSFIFLDSRRPRMLSRGNEM